MIVRSIRARITIWYSLVLALGLTVAGLITYAIVRRQMEHSSDAAMTSTQRAFAAGVVDETSEGNGVLRVWSANELLTQFRDDDRAILLLTENGELFAGQPGSIDRTMLRSLAARRAFGFTTGDEVRMLLSPVSAGKTFIVVIAQSLGPQRKTLADLRRAMLITAPLALIAAALGGYLLARKSLEPVVGMSAKARAIRSTNLSERIEVANPHDELGELAVTLNDLLAHLDQSFAAQRRFMADASHELRSPVAILQGELDVTLSRDDRDVAEYRDSLAVMRRTVRRLTRIVRDLFLLARSDAGEVPVKIEPLYLDELVSETVRAYKTVAAEKSVVLAAECDGELRLHGDEDLLQRMIGNLLENAIRHTVPETEVRVRCSTSGDHARIEVRDHASGVPEESREQIFARFFRVDAARGVIAGSGAGLGLPIARWIAEAHGGTLRLERSGAGGSVFVAELPLSGSSEV